MIHQADITRDGDDLVVVWSGSDDALISVTSQDGDLTVAANASSGSARFAALGAHVRHHARLEAADGSVFVTAERLLQMQGTVNFRDLGGYVGLGGRRLKWGRVYRSDDLGALSPGDVAVMAELGVRVICDLRREEERDHKPSLLPPDAAIEVLHLPIGGAAAETRSIAAKMMNGQITEFDEQAMADVYAVVLRLHGLCFGEIARRAADPANHAVLIHCTAGKDRTGLASALLLSLVGVSDAQICADYALTSRYYSARKFADISPRLISMGVDAERVKPFFDASETVMAQTLENLRATYGDVEQYMSREGGLSSSDIERLRNVLLEEETRPR